MRRFALAALAAFFFPLLAYAADLGPRVSSSEPAHVLEPPSWNRSGFYVGAAGGYENSVLKAEGVQLGNGELMAGPFVGYNYRLSPTLMLGIEADWIFTKVSGSTDVGGLTLSASHDHQASVRGRVGMPLGPALVYATAGPAWQHSRISVGSATESSWQLGGVAGGGIEVELSRTLFMRLEGLHYIFPESSQTPFSDLFDSKNQHTTIRAGVGFKLN